MSGDQIPVVSQGSVRCQEPRFSHKRIRNWAGASVRLTEPGQISQLHPANRAVFVPAKADGRSIPTPPYIFTERSLSALPITDTDDRLMAAAAKIGEIRMPRNGKRIPAATGTPAAL